MYLYENQSIFFKFSCIGSNFEFGSMLNSYLRNHTFFWLLFRPKLRGWCKNWCIIILVRLQFDLGRTCMICPGYVIWWVGLWFWVSYTIGPLHEKTILGKYPKNTNCLIFVYITKSGNPPSENQYSSTIQIPLEPCWQHSSIGIWNIEKYWFLKREFPLLKMKPKGGNWYFGGVS